MLFAKIAPLSGLVLPLEEAKLFGLVHARVVVTRNFARLALGVAMPSNASLVSLTAALSTTAARTLASAWFVTPAKAG